RLQKPNPNLWKHPKNQQTGEHASTADSRRAQSNPEPTAQHERLSGSTATIIPTKHAYRANAKCQALLEDAERRLRGGPEPRHDGPARSIVRGAFSSSILPANHRLRIILITG